MMMTSWQRWSATDIGNRRAQNEDALVCRDHEGLWAVIDGMGGINAGNAARAMHNAAGWAAIEGVMEGWKKR